MCVHRRRCLQRSEESEALELELQVLRIELGASGRAALILLLSHLCIPAWSF